jgi:hypothetical protein
MNFRTFFFLGGNEISTQNFKNARQVLLLLEPFCQPVDVSNVLFNAWCGKACHVSIAADWYC